MVIAIPMLLFVVTLVFGMPIAFCMALAGFLGIFLVTNSLDAAMGVVGTSIYRCASDYVLTTIPMFILLAYLTSESGMARSLYRAATSWVSQVPGGLSIGTVFAGAVFGALSGSSTAAGTVLSEVSLPSMRENKYSDVLSTGSICLGSTLALLIPPSTITVIYGIQTETSITRLLLAGLVPGIVLAIVTAVVIIIWVRLSPGIAPGTYYSTWSERWKSVVACWPAAILIILMLGMLYSGVVTASEVAAIGAFAALIVAVLMRRLTWKTATGALRSTVRTTSMIFAILMGATIFSYYITLTQVPQMLVASIQDMNLNRYIVIVLIIVGYFIMSMCMDELPLLILTLPFTFPLIVSLGFDPIWFGTLSVMMVIMGLIFPPVGMVAFVVSAMARVELATVFRGNAVLLIGVLVVTALLIVCPELALWLPSQVR